MFNLLPEAEKVSILSEYRIRRGIVFFAFLFVVGLIALVSLFPSYLFSAAKVRDAQVNIVALEHSAIFTEEATLNSDLSVAKVKLAALTPAPNQSSVASLLDAIMKARTESIRLNGFLFTRTPNSTTTISVSGIALDRESLSSFEDTLKSDPRWGEVDLPVSNFAKDTNDAFTLQLSGTF